LERIITIYSVVTGLPLISKIRNILNSAFCAYKRKYKERQPDEGQIKQPCAKRNTLREITWYKTTFRQELYLWGYFCLV